MHFGPAFEAIQRGTEPVRDVGQRYMDYQHRQLRIPLDVVRNVRDFFSPGTPPIPDTADNFIRKWNDEQPDSIQPSEARAMMQWMRSLDEDDMNKPEVQAIGRALREYDAMRNR